MAWGLCKCSHAVVLILIFLIAIRSGVVHAVYTIIRQTSCPPVGFSILRAFLIKPVHLSGYSPRSSERQGTHGMSSIDLQTAFGYNPGASMLQNIWGPLAVLVVMQLYSYERRQSKRSGSSDYDAPEIGPFAFARRLLFRHAEKILSLALFYASLSPISAFGFLYLSGLINCSRLPKLSQKPAKIFLVYSGLLIMVEYLFQMWGNHAEMFPGQEHCKLSLFMGLQLYNPGFKGLESGLRGKVVVIVACLLQYNVFHWLDKRHVYGNGGKWNEPCPLFNAIEVPNDIPAGASQSKQFENSTSPTFKRSGRSHSWPTFNSALSQGPDSVTERDSAKKIRNFHLWESSKDSLKWDRKRILFLRKERMEMQKTVFKVSIKFWFENMFNLFGLEINMIALLLASFAVLNAISLLYIASLAACKLKNKYHAMTVGGEYQIYIFATAKNVGIIVDDPRMLIWYYGVFMFSCFKFRADQSSCFTGLEMYQKILSQWKSASVLSDLSFETKGYWTFVDHLRLYGYCHLLDFVLSLILITGTFEYDILHLGYLCFALVFFRMRLKILKQGNRIFRFLRMYNFVLIVMSLAYQSPFVGNFSSIKHGSIESINELVGFHKYDYGFRITSRSAIVEIIIFVLVALQSYMFSFPEFHYVSKYLEKEQIGAILRQQEKKAAWKTAQLRHIRKAEELKHLRSLQVEKMKSEMLNLQNQQHNMNTKANCCNASLEIDGLRKRANSSVDLHHSSVDLHQQNGFRKQDLDMNIEPIGSFDGKQSLLSEKSKSPLIPQYRKYPMDSPHGIVDGKERTKNNDVLDLEIRNCYKLPIKRKALVSAIHFIGNGLSQVQSLGNVAVNNLMNYLKIERGELESTEDSSEDEVYYEIEIENQNVGSEPLEPIISTHSIHEHTMPNTACHQIGIILRYMWSRMRSNNDVDGGWTADLNFCKRRIKSCTENAKCSTSQERLQRLFLPLKNILKVFIRSLCRYWKSLTWDAETPPYFVQLSMEVNSWPKEGIQPKKIESRINKLLKILHKRRCKEDNHFKLHSASRVRVQSIEKGEENEKLCLVVFEVLYASPPIEFAAEEWYTSLTPAEDVCNEIQKAQHVGIFKEIGFPYRILSVIGGGKREIDLYAYIFGADLAVFFLISILYESIMKANCDFLEVYQLEDQFPEDFVLVLMYAWDMDPLHRYSGILALRAIYLTKSISLVLQAIQLHFGIPHKSTLYRQFLTSSVSRINVLGFRLYRAIPFLYELRCVLDWSCTTTSLTMHDWLKLEDIHASLFLVKCDVDLNRATHQQGQKQTKMTKFSNGICLFFVLLCVIWAPMLMYSSGNPTNIANPIKDASARVDIQTSSGRLTLFETTLCEKISWENLEARASLDPQGYLSAYNVEDIQLICCHSDASTLWLVPPIVQARFTKSLRRNMDITFSWEFIRDRPKGKEAVKYELTILEQDLPKSSEVTNVFNGTSNSFAVFNIYPRYFRVTGSGDVRSLQQSVELVSGDLVLNRGDPEWWSFYDLGILGSLGCGKFPGPMAIIVSEETPHIYAARAAGELEVEEILYWTLIKIYRSPHMLLEYTQAE
ncbi:unnamed protein product [Sphenostylis stenocarpa]|uniref:Piezo non-specific cation channel R-Ras-binding domain-containing protein n=1 Tax=Sphenostylis stenocarpa TaxID=92480 RepID=A0AA86VRQ0_9FABA|nr:unnamed protein product [Sphenostylis stenocarpa]